MKPSREQGQRNKLGRLYASWSDLGEAKAYIGVLLHFWKPAPEDKKAAILPAGAHKWVENAFLTAAIVSYARPFLGSEGTGGNTMIDEKVCRVLTPEQQLLHNTLVDARRKTVGHSDYNRFLSLHGARHGARVTTLLAPTFSIVADPSGALEYDHLAADREAVARNHHEEALASYSVLDALYPGGSTMSDLSRVYVANDGALSQIDEMISDLMNEIANRIDLIEIELQEDRSDEKQ